MSQRLTLLLGFLLVGFQVQLGEAEDRTISQELKSTPDGQLFYVELKVGEGAGQQTFNMLVSTTSFITWLPSIELSPNRGYVNKTVALPSLPDYQFLFWNGLGGRCNYYRMHSDTMQFGSQVVRDQPFAIARPGEHQSRSINFPPDWKLDGFLGLSGHESQPEGVDYLFKNLHKSAYIDRLKFSLYINNSASNNLDDQQEAKGALILGGVDEKYYTGDINYTKLYKNPARNPFMLIHRTLIIVSIHLDWSRVGLGTRTTMRLHESLRTGRVYLNSPPARLRLDSTSKLFVGDKNILDKIHLDFLGAKLIAEPAGVYMFKDCRLNNKPDFVFTVDGLEFKITPKDYVLHGDIEHARLCFSAFKSPANWYEPPIWVFGTRFLRKFYTLFDFENDLVGFATAK